MYIIRNYSIPNATMAAAAIATPYWITGANTSVLQSSNIRLVSATGTTIPTDIFDLSNYDYLKVYFSSTGMTSCAGLIVTINDLWPDLSQANVGIAAGILPGAAANQALTTAIGAGAFLAEVNISQYSSTTAFTGAFPPFVFKPGQSALSLNFGTAVPTAGGPLNIIVAGERYGHEG